VQQQRHRYPRREQQRHLGRGYRWGAHGVLQLIVRKGDLHPVTGTVITALSFLPAPANVRGQTRNASQTTGDLLYRASFAGGGAGIYKVVFP